MGANSGDVFRWCVDRIKMKYVATFGTALGLYRDNDFIPNDTDLDIDVVGYEGIEKDLTERLQAELIRRVMWNGKPSQLAYLKDGIIFDISVNWEHQGLYATFRDDGLWAIDKDEYDNPLKKETKYGSVFFPCNVEKYLEMRYGDWKTPTNKKADYTL